MPLGGEGNAILASPAQGSYVTRTGRGPVPPLFSLLSVGRNSRAGGPVLGLVSPQGAGEKGKEGAFWILLGSFLADWTSSPQIPGMSELPSPHSALSLLPPHSHTLPDDFFPSHSTYTSLPAQASDKQ